VEENRWAIVGVDDSIEVRVWDDWYQYENSYWTAEKKTGVDRGEPSRAIYAFHMLVGHHGVVSLTPVWLLSIWGAGIWMRQPEVRLRGLAALTILLFSVCVTFYIARPLEDRNYGGVCCGFRWLFWLIPLWLICLLPAADLLANSRRGQILAGMAFGLSVFSANFSAANPWTHPWIFAYWTKLGWISY
jgi:hypothetical protein